MLRAAADYQPECNGGAAECDHKGLLVGVFQLWFELNNKSTAMENRIVETEILIGRITEIHLTHVAQICYTVSTEQKSSPGPK